MAFERETKKSRGPARGKSGGKGAGKSFGGKPGAKKSFGDKKPAGRSFGDKPRSRDGEKSFGDRKPRSLPREGARSSRAEFGDRPKRSFADKPRRSYDDKPKREGRSFDDRPKRQYEDRPRREGRSFEDRPKRDFGDRPKRDFGDRPPRREGSFEDRPKRSYSDRPRRESGDRPVRRDGDERPARREYSSDRPRRDFSDRPKREFRSYEDRPQRGPKRDFAPKKREGFEKRRPRDEDADIIDQLDMKAPKEERGEPTMMGHELLFYGIHAVQAALRNKHRTVTKIWVTESAQERLDEAFDKKRHPEPIVVQRREIDRRLPEGAVHQGLAIAVEPLQDVFLSDIVNEAIAKPEKRSVVVVLDEVTDPHNVGAVLRSMSAFGAKAMIVHKRNAPGVTGVMAKIATGALEHVPMIPVTNLAQAMEELKLAGFYVVGLDERADFPIQKARKEGPIALVLGAEGEGLRAKTRATCNAIATIETFGDIKSLNVSNAAAIALYSLTQKT